MEAKHVVETCKMEDFVVAKGCFATHKSMDSPSAENAEEGRVYVTYNVEATKAGEDATVNPK